MSKTRDVISLEGDFGSLGIMGVAVWFQIAMFCLKRVFVIRELSTTIGKSHLTS